MLYSELLTKYAKQILPRAIRKLLRLGKLYFRYAFLKDKHRYCPVLAENIKDFIPQKQQLITHKNEALSRHRMLADYLRNETELFSTQDFNLLHIAPSDCLADLFLSQDNIHFIAVDIFASGYDYPEYVRNADVLDLPFGSESFDFVICNHVLEHIPDDQRAMQEMQRVLQPGGTAFITVPINQNASITQFDPTVTNPKQRRKLYGQWDHVRFYALDILDRLHEHGFIPQAIRYREHIGEKEAERKGIQNDILLVAKKLK